MASVTQTIPTLTGGLSQQPDELKIPGQVNEAKNVLPDVTHGLLKRPGSTLIASLSDYGTQNTNFASRYEGRWFSYYRDEAEQYIGQVTRDGFVKMWRCSDGQAMTVYNSATTLTFNNINWSTEAGSQAGFQNPIKFGSFDSNNFQAAYNAINGKVNFATNTGLSGSKIVAKNITNATGYFQNNVELELISLVAYSNGYQARAGVRNQTGPSSGSGTCTLKISLTLEPNAYLVHSNDEDIQTLTLNDFTFITNRSVNTAMSSTVETVRPPEVFIQLKATSYARQYSVNLYDNENFSDTVKTATRISIDLIQSSNNYGKSGNNAGAMVVHSLRDDNSPTNIPTNKKADQGNDAYCPNVGTRIFAVSDNVTLVDKNAVGGTQADGNLTDVNYDYTVQVKTSSGGNNNSAKNLYFRVRTVGQSVPFTEGSTAIDADGSSDGQTTVYKCRYTVTHDLLYGGEGWNKNDYFYFWMKDGYYKCTIDEISTANVQANLALARPNPTPFDTETAITAESILGDIRTAILADGNFTSSNVQIIGNGIYVTRPQSQGDFNGTIGAPDLLGIMQKSVKSVDDLPSQCKHGYIVKVANSAADEDDYYVKFYGNNDKDGEGVWEECNEPGRKISFDQSTMPLQLIRQADGTFQLDVVTYDDCQVGDSLTNPEPSFVGFPINRMCFFRNRMVMLSEENVIMSRPGEFFNFWSKTATTFTPQDVIDLSCSSEYPSEVFDAIQINAGLLLFTKNKQFMLTTDSDVLSPETAKINAVSSYNFNEKTNPISLGTTVAFLDNANKFTRFFEMSNVLRQGEPDIVDQSQVISQALSKNISIISNSRENSVVFFSEKGSDTLYGFRYFATGERRLLQSWFTWEVAGDIQYHCMMDDALYLITRHFGTSNQASQTDYIGPKDQMIKISLKTDEDDFITPQREQVYNVEFVHSGSENGTFFTGVGTNDGIGPNDKFIATNISSNGAAGKFVNGVEISVNENYLLSPVSFRGTFDNSENASGSGTCTLTLITTNTDINFNRVNLDHTSSLSTQPMVYDPVTNITTIPVPKGYHTKQSHRQLVAYDNSYNTNNLGRYAICDTTTVGSIKIPGVWSPAVDRIFGNDSGKGYLTAPPVKISGGSGTTLADAVIDENGTIVDYNIVSSYGYGSSDNLTVTIGQAWEPNVGYAINQQVVNDTNHVYTCTQAGTSASSGGPTGSLDITLTNVPYSLNVDSNQSGFYGIATFGTIGDNTTNVAQFITNYAGLFSSGPKDNLGSKVTVTDIQSNSNPTFDKFVNGVELYISGITQSTNTKLIRTGHPDGLGNAFSNDTSNSGTCTITITLDAPIEITDGTAKWKYARDRAIATAEVDMNKKFVIGYLYDMSVKVPTLYVTRPEGNKFRSDSKSSLIIHRVKLSFGPLGVYSTTLKRKGKPDYTETRELGLAGQVETNRDPTVEEVIETVPCYERNTNLSLTITSSHPSPATIYSLAWEGDFTNRFYRRV